jgi:hypothetical protein
MSYHICWPLLNAFVLEFVAFVMIQALVGFELDTEASTPTDIHMDTEELTPTGTNTYTPIHMHPHMHTRAQICTPGQLMVMIWWSRYTPGFRTGNV